MQATLSAIHYLGADDFVAPYTGGAGIIFMLHHVTPEPPRSFEPNRILKVTPQFLESVIEQVRQSGFDIVSLDDVKTRLAGEAKKPFAVFTLDDGYKDNRDFAYPIFKRHDAPFAIYVPAAYADGNGDLWWLTLERALARLSAIDFGTESNRRQYSLKTDAEKNTAFHAIYWQLRQMPEREARAAVSTICRQAGIDTATLCRDLVMNWDEIRELAKDPLVTIGAHTVNHLAVAKLSDAEARREIADSIKRIESELQRPCRHFSYPYGDNTSAGERDFKIASDLGLETAVTTRKGLLRKSHAGALTALPRLSLNGDYQDSRYVKVLLSGLPFALRDGVRRIMAPLAN